MFVIIDYMGLCTAQCPWRQNRALDPLHLEPQVIVSHQKQMIGTSPWWVPNLMFCYSISISNQRASSPSSAVLSPNSDPLRLDFGKRSCQCCNKDMCQKFDGLFIRF